MTIKDIALQIPAEYRKEILLTNMIAEAKATATDASMNYLGVIWKNYVAPEDLTCGLCLERILKNYRELLPVFVELEKQSNLLDQL